MIIRLPTPLAPVAGKRSRQLHGLAIKCGMIHALLVGNSIISMYGRHGFAEEAKRTSKGMEERSLVLWTAMLSTCLRKNDVESIIDGNREMLNLGIGCDSSCFTTVLDACSQHMNLALVSQVHCSALKLQYLSDVFVRTALVDTYAKSGSLENARLVLNELPNNSITAFNTIFVGYMEANGPWDDAFMMFNQLRLNGIQPDEVTITVHLRISAENSSLNIGESLQAYAFKAGMGEGVNVGNVVITMYTKCGSIQVAFCRFSETVRHDVITWNAMIAAHALHGQGDEALLLFESIIQKGTKKDETALVSVQQACIYSGQIVEGIQIF